MKLIKLFVVGFLVLMLILVLVQDLVVQGMGVMGQVIFFVGFILIFYFLIWCLQFKCVKEYKVLMFGLNKGDEVVIFGGVVGKIIKVIDDFIVVEVVDNVEIKVQKVVVVVVLLKGILKDI